MFSVWDAELKIQEIFGPCLLRNVFALAEACAGKCSQTAVRRG